MAEGEKISFYPPPPLKDLSEGKMIGVVVTKAIFEGRNRDHDSITIHDLRNLPDERHPTIITTIRSPLHFSTDVLNCQAPWGGRAHFTKVHARRFGRRRLKPCGYYSEKTH